MTIHDDDIFVSSDSSTQVLPERNEVIEKHLWLVQCIARSIVDALPKQIDIEDLISAGTVGLIRAVDDFDPAKGAKLETYARYRIRGAILDELRRQDMLPHSTRTKLKQLDAAIHVLERRLGRYPTDDEIAAQAGLSPEELSRLLAMAISVDLYSLEEILDNPEGTLRLADGEPTAGHEDPLHRLEREELAKVLVGGIKDLPKMEKAVLGLYYYEGLRMEEIGEVLGVSESRVSQVHSKAILLLRAKLRIHISG